MKNPAEKWLAQSTPVEIRKLDRLLYAIAIFVVVLLIWAFWAHIEEQVRAPGTVIASSRSQVVQTEDGGTLKVLNVKEGDLVKAGDLIAELDPVRFQASNDEMVAKVAGLEANVQRLEAELNGRPLVFKDGVRRYPDIVAAQRDLHERRKRSQQEELDALAESVRLAQEELNVTMGLVASGDVSKAELLKSQRQINDLRATRTNKQNAFRQDAQLELAKTRAELEQTEQVLAQRNEALLSTKLRAPMTGVVKNVKFTTRGAVLRAGDELLQIVPSDDPLIIEAKVKSADVAHLRNGLRANVKLDAYDYTVYGALDGKVVYISPDTLIDETQRDQPPYYRVHIETEGNAPRGRKPLDVRPGMTATAEIITGDRSVANFILKPLRRGFDAALHER